MEASGRDSLRSGRIPPPQGNGPGTLWIGHWAALRAHMYVVVCMAKRKKIWKCLLRGKHTRVAVLCKLSVLDNMVMSKTCLFFSMKLWCVAQVLVVHTWAERLNRSYLMFHMQTLREVPGLSLSGNWLLWIGFSSFSSVTPGKFRCNHQSYYSELMTS